MANETIQKGKSKTSSSSTTGKAGANKEDPNRKKKNKDSVDGVAGKSASSEGSESLKFGSMISASISELKDTMAGKFDQLEQILTPSDIWEPEHKPEERDDALSDYDTDKDGGRIYAEHEQKPSSKKPRLTSASSG